MDSELDWLDWPPNVVGDERDFTELRVTLELGVVKVGKLHIEILMNLLAGNQIRSITHDSHFDWTSHRPLSTRKVT